MGIWAQGFANFPTRGTTFYIPEGPISQIWTRGPKERKQGTISIGFQTETRGKGTSGRKRAEKVGVAKREGCSNRGVFYRKGLGELKPFGTPFWKRFPFQREKKTTRWCFVKTNTLVLREFWGKQPGGFPLNQGGFHVWAPQSGFVYRPLFQTSQKNGGGGAPPLVGSPFGSGHFYPHPGESLAAVHGKKHGGESPQGLGGTQRGGTWLEKLLHPLSGVTANFFRPSINCVGEKKRVSSSENILLAHRGSK